MKMSVHFITAIERIVKVMVRTMATLFIAFMFYTSVVVSMLLSILLFVNVRQENDFQHDTYKK
jgi:hypothetical protein